ncbi:hypothetical protein Q8A67_008157 [Cirrhinus molitorella]|uniref:Uncharacterized protein n=1 Tax=Cirrhinus molitorella TaxID=172907 RepID=A0AA88TRH3_9TELE|nr:hypothetical protein Q8A67_008157 [Cirrhinus molitorella]
MGELVGKAHETDPPLALAVGASPEWTEETSSLASGEAESATTEHSSRDEKVYEELLEAYQADLLKDLSTAGSIDEEAFLELRQATDLSHRATKQTARAIGRSMAALVSTERHLWLNLTGIKDKDRAFLLDAPISPSGLFGEVVSTVATRFREAKRYEEAFVRFLPRRAQESGLSATRSRPGPVPLRREEQKESVASRAPPCREWGAAHRASQSASKRPDLRSIIAAKKKS